MKPAITTIVIQLIPEGEMRMPGLGDWWVNGQTLQVRSVDGPGHQPFLVALHELVEAYLCADHGISTEAVDAFDAAFDAEDHPDEAEPGDDPRAPYRREHRCAMLVEHMVAHFLGLDGYGTVR